MALFNRYLFYQYDPGATATYRYYASEPQFQGYITTSGSSTTTTSISTLAPNAAFRGLVAEDMLLARSGENTPLRRTIATATSATSVVVNAAWDLDTPATGWVCDAFKFSGGTAATDGWFWTGGLQDKQVQVNVETFGATSVVLTLQGTYNPNIAGVDIVTPVSYTATGSDIIAISEEWPYMRVGLNQTGAGTDSVTVFFSASTNNITN